MNAQWFDAAVQGQVKTEPGVRIKRATGSLDYAQLHCGKPNLICFTDQHMTQCKECIGCVNFMFPYTVHWQTYNLSVEIQMWLLLLGN